MLVCVVLRYILLHTVNELYIYISKIDLLVLLSPVYKSFYKGMVVDV